MKILASIVAIVIATFVLVAVAYAGYWAVRDLMDGYPLLDLTTRAVLAGIAASALAVGALVAAGLRSAARLLLQGRLVDSRLDLYRRVVISCLPLVERATGRSSARTDGLTESLAALGQGLVLLGGPEVIKAHAALRAAESPAEIEARFGELLREMRRELGHPASYQDSQLPWTALLTPDDGPGRTDGRLQSALR